jgi:hypothetical protein
MEVHRPGPRHVQQRRLEDLLEVRDQQEVGSEFAQLLDEPGVVDACGTQHREPVLTPLHGQVDGVGLADVVAARRRPRRRGHECADADARRGEQLGEEPVAELRVALREEHEAQGRRAHVGHHRPRTIFADHVRESNRA